LGIGGRKEIIHAGDYRRFFSQAKWRTVRKSAMDTILVPLDISESTPKVLLEAETLAAKLQAKLFLLHVIEPIASYVPVGASMDLIASAPPATGMDAEQTEIAKARLERLAAPLRGKGLDVACEATFGIPVDEILDQAATQGANYLVLGSHGHGALFHLFGGSVVTGVLKRSVCPVVVVPVRKQ
jgi:nucleotide-binding universal stress UspA family protein